MKRYLLILSIICVVEMSLTLYLTFWRNDFWRAMSEKQQLEFLNQLDVFTAAALGISFIPLISEYLIKLTSIKWRKILNDRALSKIRSDIKKLNQSIQQ